MKKNVFYYFFAALFAVTMFASCSDDDGLNEDPNPGGGTGTGEDSVSVADNFVGEYKGTLDVSVGGASTPLMYQNITISKAGNDSIDLVISNFTFAGAIELGDVTLADCQLSSEDNTTYTFHREEEMTFSNPLVGTCPVTSDVTLFGDSVVVELAIVWNGGIDVNVVYKGVKLKGTEKTEAQITSFTFDSSVDANSVVISQPVINEDNTITFGVSEDADVTALVPTITVSDGATLSPAGGVATDFSDDITYTVVSEDGKTVAEYTVNVPSKLSSWKYSFDEWGTKNGTSTGLVDTQSASWDSPLPLDELASANEGVAALKTPFGGKYEGDYAMTKEENGYSGSAVKLQTLYTNDLLELIPGSIPAITPASLYTGTFEFSMQTEAAKQLTMTKFGISYDKKPLTFKGVYKYAKGDNYIDGSQEPALENQEGEDRGLILAVLYEASADETLDGTNLKTASNRVLLAQVGGDAGVADTNGEWVNFEISFEPVGDAEYSSDKQYKLAIVCQSSVNGSEFKGAANSTLWVDELEVIGE